MPFFGVETYFIQFNTLFKIFFKNSINSIGVSPITSGHSICMFLPCFETFFKQCVIHPI
jgi:hypothetical protein